MKQLFFLLALTVTYLTANAQTGTLDKTFGNSGLLAVDGSGLAGTPSFLVLKDDKMLAIKATSQDGRTHSITRLLPDGQIDKSFGKDGSQEIFKFTGVIHTLCVQPDDKIILVTGTYVESATASAITLFRYLPDGTPDSSFGINGIYVDSSLLSAAASDATIQPDGKILACGQYVVNATEGDIYPLVARYNEDGTPDKSFGTNGKSIVYELQFIPQSIALQKDGKIVCAGDNGVPSLGLVARYTVSGKLDSTFGTNGTVKSSFTKKVDFYTDVAIQEDGKIVAVGTAQYNAFNGVDFPMLAIARYQPDGALDETFDQDGKIMIPFDSYTLGKSVALQPDGKIIVSGSTAELDFNYCVGRLNADGSLDTEFGTEGKTITDINKGSSDEVYQVGLQSTGNIIVSGISRTDNLYLGVFARYIGGKAQNTLPIAKIKSWLQQRAIKWQPIYSSGNIDFYAIEKSKSYSGTFTEIKRYEAEALPQPLVTNQTITYSYNLATEATANATTVSYYRVRAVYSGGNSVYSDVVSDSLLLQNNTLSIYPNPVKNVLTLSGLPAGKNAVINLLNRNGKILATANTSATAYTRNVSSLRSGIYYLQILLNGKTETLRFIKE